MRTCAEYCIDMPDDFPVEELNAFMAAARRVLLIPKKGPEWSEFAGASNLIGWRYRASSEYRLAYKESWTTEGVTVDHEGAYRRERALFGMFSSGVASLESVTYALAALSSHPRVLAMPFGAQEQRFCSPTRLSKWLAPLPTATSMAAALTGIATSSEWKLWVDLRNRMTHRSDLPRVVFGAVGGTPPPAKALHFASTSSTPIFEGDLNTLDALHEWLSSSIATLLNEGAKLCPT